VCKNMEIIFFGKCYNKCCEFLTFTIHVHPMREKINIFCWISGSHGGESGF
jgi:hypothetical protein